MEPAVSVAIVGSVLLLLAIITAGLLWYFKSPVCSGSITSVIFVSWYLGFIGIVLLPLDLCGVISVEIAMISWQIVYWTTFVLAWVILPMLFEWLLAGDWSFGGRLCTALVANLKIYLLYAVAVTGFTVYLISTDRPISEVFGFLMACGNTYGLLWIIVLMGLGLAEIPSRMWSYPSLEKKLHGLYAKVSYTHTDSVEVVQGLERIEKCIACALQDILDNNDCKLAEYLDRLCSLCYSSNRPSSCGGVKLPAKLGNPSKQGADQSDTEDCRLNVVTVKGLAMLHRELKLVLNRLRQLQWSWLQLLDEVQVLEHEASTKEDESVEGVAPVEARAAWCYKLCWRLLASLCGIVSALVMWLEFRMALAETGWLPDGYQQRFQLSRGDITWWLPVVSILLSYMAACTYSSLFSMKMFTYMALRGPGHSDPEMLVFNASYLVRLQFALSLNFVLMLSGHHDSGDFHFTEIR